MTAPDELAHAVLDRVTAPYAIAGGATQVTVACHLGLAIGGDAAGNVADIVRDAHQALVQARDLGPAHLRRPRRVPPGPLQHARRRAPTADGARQRRVPAPLPAHRAGRLRRADRRRGAAALAGARGHQHRHAVPARLPAAAREVGAHRARRALGDRGDVPPGRRLVRGPPDAAAAVRHLQHRCSPAGHARLRRHGARGHLDHGSGGPPALPRHHRADAPLQRRRHLVGAAPPEGGRGQARRSTTSEPAPRRSPRCAS